MEPGDVRARRSSRLRVLGASLVLAVSAATVLAQDPTPTSPQPPPWQRVLKGDEAKRVEALEKSIQDLEKKGQFAEAVAPAREVLAIRGRVQGEDHWETGNARIKEQTCARVAGLPRAMQSELAAAIRQNVEAESLHRRGLYAEAEPLFRRALAIHRRTLGEDHHDTVVCFKDLASNLGAQGKLAEGEALLQEALAIAYRILGADHPLTASTYNDVGMNLDDQGKHAEAEPWLQKAMATWCRTLGEDDPEVTLSYNNLAYNLDGQGRYLVAEPLFRKALAIRRRTLGEDHPLTARSYSNLAYNLNAQGRHAEAQPLDRKALAIRRRTLGEDHPLTGRSYNNLATDLHDLARYADAEPLLRKALAIHRGTLGEDHPDMAVDHENLADNLDGQGRHAEAQALFDKALAIRRRTLGEDHPLTARSYNNLAEYLDSQGKYANARPLLHQALAIYRGTLGEDHPETASSDYNLAMNLCKQGQHADAEPLFRKALAIRRRVLGEDHPETVMSYHGLATNLHLSGRSTEAATMAAAAARGYEAARLRVSFIGLQRADFASRSSPLPLLAALLARRESGQDAWVRWEAGLARGLFDDLAARRSQPFTSDERRRREELVGQLNRLDNQVGALAGTKALADDQRKRLDELKDRRLELQGRLVELEAELVRKYQVAAGAVYDLAPIQAQLPADAALVGWLDLKTSPGVADPQGDHWACVVRHRGAPRWVRIMGTGPGRAWTRDDDQRPGQVRELLAGADRRAWRGPLAALAAQRLAPLEPALRAGDDGPAVRHLIVLPSPAMAGIPVEALCEARAPDSPRYVVSYAPSGTLFAWLGERRREDDRPARSRRLLALGDPVPPAVGESAAPTPRPPDQGLLVQQVVAGSNAEQAGIRPGDVLLRYDGAALAARADLQKRVEAGDPRAAGVAVAVWRDGRTFDRTLRPGPLGVMLNDRPAAEAILARREADALLRRTRGAAFARLPGSRREVQAIAGLFDRAAVYLDSDASEQTLESLRARGELATFAVIHLATHGEIDDLSPMNSRLLLAQDRLPDPAAASPADGPAYDGTLTAGEVLSTWKLDADLVTLSACRSGLGRQGGGEGYIGFAQAFFLAGARSLVVSLWEVDDRATSLLMTRFYQNWLGKRPGLTRPLSKAEALREARAWLRDLTDADAESELRALARGELRPSSARPPTVHPFAHPHDWAGFILIGDPE